MIWRFRHSISEFLDFLRYFEVLIGRYRRFGTACRSKFQGSSIPKTISLAYLSCPETSASNYKSVLHNIAQQRTSQFVAILSSLLLQGLANNCLHKLCQHYYVYGPHVNARRADNHLRITKREATGNKIVPSCFHLRREMTESTQTDPLPCCKHAREM